MSKLALIQESGVGRVFRSVHINSVVNMVLRPPGTRKMGFLNHQQTRYTIGPILMITFTNHEPCTRPHVVLRP